MQTVGVVFNAKPIMPKRSEVITIIIFYIPGSCAEPLGLGWDNKLPDSAFTASTELSPGERREIHD